MKKYISIFMFLTLMGAVPLGVDAQNTTPQAADQTADITSINKNIQDIEQELKDSKAAQAQDKAVQAQDPQALSKPETESSRPEDIVAIHKSIRPDIDQTWEESNAIRVAPRNEYESASSKKVEALPTADQILDSVISPANREKTMDLQFEEANLESITHTIGEVAGINIVLDPALKTKTLALHLKKVKIREALSIMAESFDLAFKKIGNSLYITTKERVRGDNVTAQLINLRYIKSNDVKDMAHNLVNSINVSREGNSIMVVGTPDEINKVMAMVKKMDVPQPQVILEAKIIEINKNAMKNLGMNWSSSISTNFQETGRPVNFDNVQNSVGSALKIYSMARSPIQFNATLEMLENDNLAKTLSNPRVITMNNKEAEIFVGDKIPYTVSSISGGVTSYSVEFVEPGIRLKITPSIIDKDFVVVKIEPEVSYIYSFIGPQNQYPWVKTRNATAYVRIQNNHPFVLGGLLDKEDQKNLYKVPILGNLPLVGNLFSYQKHTATDSELIIVVVPVIVNQ